LFLFEFIILIFIRGAATPGADIDTMQQTVLLDDQGGLPLFDPLTMAPAA
jgi:hypothetical protein